MQWFTCVCVCIIFLLPICSSSIACVNKPIRPNIIVIMADDVGWNDVSFHGSDEIATPNIDALGYHGVIFNRHYSQQACTPSRAAFLTGQYPIRVGLQGFPLDVCPKNFMPKDVATLPQSLKNLGYRTHLVGKWHLGYSRKDYTPIGYGYDTHFGYWNGYMGYFEHDISYLDNTYNGTDLHDELQPVMDKSGQYATDLFTERAVEIINDHPTKDPLYMVVSHLAGHTGKTVQEPVRTVLEVRNETATNEKYAFIQTPDRRKLAEIVENVDASVGEVVEALAKKDMLKNSVIVFFSDNGAPTYGLHENFGSNYPLRGIKMSMYEGAIRTPALVFSPKIKFKGRVFNDLFHISDWVPTLLKAAGGNVGVLGNIDGFDQWAALSAPNVLINKHKRSELLVDFDPMFNCGAYIGYEGRYKLVNNSFFNYDFSGDEGFTNKPLNYQRVKDSKVNTYIEKIVPIPLTSPQVNLLRSQTKIECSSSPGDASKRQNIKPCTGICLFDLWADPCEYDDVSEQFPAITRELFLKLDLLKSQARPKPQESIEPACDPKLCCDTWFNWLDQDGCWFDQRNAGAGDKCVR